MHQALFLHKGYVDEQEAAPVFEHSSSLWVSINGNDNYILHSSETFQTLFWKHKNRAHKGDLAGVSGQESQKRLFAIRKSRINSKGGGRYGGWRSIQGKIKLKPYINRCDTVWLLLQFCMIHTVHGRSEEVGGSRAYSFLCVILTD